MFPYLFVLAFVMFWIVVEQKTLKRKAFWMPLIILVLLSSIRSFEVGADSVNYVNSFINNVDVEYFVFRDDVEIGYQTFEYLLLNLTHDYFWFFFFSSFFIIYVNLKIIKNYSVNYIFSVYLFITLGIYTFSLMV